MIMDRLLKRVRILRPLRHRDFRLLWTGMTASLIGDGIFLVSLTWQVYELSNTPTALSIVGWPRGWHVRTIPCRCRFHR